MSIFAVPVSFGDWYLSGGEHKDLPPFLIQLLVDNYTSIISRDYSKRLKFKAVNTLTNLSTHNYTKAMNASAIGEVTQAIA